MASPSAIPRLLPDETLEEPQALPPPLGGQLGHEGAEPRRHHDARGRGGPIEAPCPVPDPPHRGAVEPERNMARFYVLALQPTLFGEVSLFRRWGRIGAAGQAMMETFEEASTASSALANLARIKSRRGYC